MRSEALRLRWQVHRAREHLCQPRDNMSGFDSNPFAEPVDVNPFQDPSVTQVTSTAADGVGEFNPFTAGALDGRTIPVSVASQPAVLHTTVEPSPQAGVAAGQAELLRQQAELEKKAAELERKEQELRDRDTARGKENNWPPLPRFFPIKPCFYQDFNEEIPVEYQRVCKMMYYLWMYHSVTLFLNLLACMVYFAVDTSTRGVDFGLSILWFILFTPVAFLCWYRPVYKAFKSDSSFSFFFFFFIFSFQVIVYIIQSVGIPGWGNSGWITAISLVKSNTAVSVFMMLVAGFFSVNAVLSILLLKMVHSMYRHTGASFQKAQDEFSQGVVNNRSFQSAAATAASSAVQGAFQ
ncbi:secretory carrier membrane protein 2, like [Megalobrama amblycephala]|uniref:secretory carrier membrane protein 2, like n=1 Tax=Megalobrama amblycephala TaxID=75352 RepID=UPI0020145F1F|nr:secretory carrier membrane protein 2, like [Megalobrama amblycephala]XP_048042295.1 secretory carrier membrane protein 2, like [Megalobrama amblycephala]